LHPNTGKWCVKHATIGALADSFYEYLFKIWVYKGKSDQKALTTYLAAMDALRNKLVQKSETNLYYFANIENDKIVKKMDHLACFSGGLLAFTSNTVEMKQTDQNVYLDLAKNITHTCHESYIRTNTHLGIYFQTRFIFHVRSND
jgi:mannosyl-oligosaccharide alpha-1,2-mannosidase